MTEEIPKVSALSKLLGVRHAQPEEEETVRKISAGVALIATVITAVNLVIFFPSFSHS
jgi:hypothetical protein